MLEADVIVVGGGIIGLWTAYLLTKSNKRVILIEQYELGHNLGSSHGRSRLIKHSHRKNHLSQLIPRAFSMWKELEKVTEKKLLHNTGHLSVVHTPSTGKLFDTLVQVMNKNRITYKYMPGESQDFSNLNFNHSYETLFEPNGAVLLADLCRETLQNELRQQGVVIYEKEKVLKIKSDDQQVSINTNKRFITASKCVLTCGPWINNILKPTGIQLKIRSCKVITYYWKEKDPSTYSRKKGFFPLMIYREKYHLYSIPSDDYPGYLKICYHVRVEVNPDSPNKEDKRIQKAEEERFTELKQLIQVYFPQIDTNAKPIEEKCLQSITPDSNFILSRHPFYSNIIIGAGFSADGANQVTVDVGHGFGVAPSVADILSNLVDTDNSDDYVKKYFPLQIESLEAKI